jgi:hypothetical protein
LLRQNDAPVHGSGGAVQGPPGTLAVEVVHRFVPAVIALQAYPLLQAGPATQHGSPPPPQRMQPNWMSVRVLLQVNPALQLLPAQHGCDSRPHAAQNPLLQTAPALQLDPAQHTSPAAPHAVQRSSRVKRLNSHANPTAQVIIAQHSCDDWPHGVHAPATHRKPLPHACPQAPQLFTSDVVSVQAELQHDWPVAHALVHEPQCAASVARSTQLVPHATVGGAHWHAPPTQTSPAPQTFPQRPQFCTSVLRFTQLALHAVVPPGQDAHAPARHTSGAAHVPPGQHASPDVPHAPLQVCVAPLHISPMPHGALSVQHGCAGPPQVG